MTEFKRQPKLNIRGVTIEPKNEVLKHNNWHLSYNAYESHYSGATTAIVIDNRCFFILNGDHRKELKHVKKLQKAIIYFIRNIDKASEFSEHLFLSKKTKDIFDLKSTMQAYINKRLINILSEKVN